MKPAIQRTNAANGRPPGASIRVDATMTDASAKRVAMTSPTEMAVERSQSQRRQIRESTSHQATSAAQGATRSMGAASAAMPR